MEPIRAFFVSMQCKGEYSMGMFVDPDLTLEVSDEKGNTIVIKAMMDFADQAKIEAALMTLKLKAQTGKNSKQVKVRPADADGEVEFDATVTNSMRVRTLLEVCIKSWSGPDFTDKNGDPIPCVTRNIRMLNPNDPLVEKVLETINENNTTPTTAPPEREPIDPNHREPVSYAE